MLLFQERIQRGDRGSGPPPPGKSQVIWVSLGNKQLDPPPPPGKSWTPSGTLKYVRFLWNWPCDLCKISWGLKKKKKKKKKKTDLDPPDENSWIRICVSTKIYDSHVDFDFKIVNLPFLDGDVPRSISYGVYISQLIRFARASSLVADFNTRNKLFTQTLLKQGDRYHKLHKTFS